MTKSVAVEHVKDNIRAIRSMSPMRTSGPHRRAGRTHARHPDRRDGGTIGTYAGVHGIGLVARDEIRGRDSPLTNRLPMCRGRCVDLPGEAHRRASQVSKEFRRDLSGQIGHRLPRTPPSVSRSGRDHARSVRESLRNTSTARRQHPWRRGVDPAPPSLFPGCWREASHASRAAAILFPSDMAVSLGFLPVFAMLAHVPPDG